MTQTGYTNAIVNAMLGWLKGLASWVLRLFNLSGDAITVDASQLFDGGETVLLHGQGAALLDMEDQPQF